MCVALVAVLAGCGARESEQAPARGSGSASGTSAGAGSGAALAERRAAAVPCEPLPFAESTPLPEASGAAWLTIGGKRALVVVGDSGHDGEVAVIDPDTGATLAMDKLPLGEGASDDIEGLAARGDRLYGLTSAGFVRVWRRAATGFQLVDGPYPIGTGADVCEATRNNCGQDYEGLALAPVDAPARDDCIGVAAGRAAGSLFCVVERDGELRVDRARAIPIVDRGKVLADCAFSDTGALFAGNNMFGLSTVYRIDGWRNPATAKVVELASVGVGFPEVVAAHGDVIYRMSDTGGSAPSLMAKFRCAAGTR